MALFRTNITQLLRAKAAIKNVGGGFQSLFDKMNNVAVQVATEK